eukprot:16437467-Heterocapsa_arctica.AAC.1
MSVSAEPCPPPGAGHPGQGPEAPALRRAASSVAGPRPPAERPSRAGSPEADGSRAAAEPEGGEAKTSGGEARFLSPPPTRIRR